MTLFGTETLTMSSKNKSIQLSHRLPIVINQGDMMLELMTPEAIQFTCDLVELILNDYFHWLNKEGLRDKTRRCSTVEDFCDYMKHLWYEDANQSQKVEHECGCECHSQCDLKGCFDTRSDEECSPRCCAHSQNKTYLPKENKTSPNQTPEHEHTTFEGENDEWYVLESDEERSESIIPLTNSCAQQNKTSSPKQKKTTVAVTSGRDVSPTEKRLTKTTPKKTTKKPAQSRSRSPTKKPVQSRSKSPTKKPAQSRSKSPIKKPAQSCSKSPRKKPAQSGNESPRNIPVAKLSPRQSPTKKHTVAKSSPRRSPTKKPPVAKSSPRRSPRRKPPTAISPKSSPNKENATVGTGFQTRPISSKTKPDATQTSSKNKMKVMKLDIHMIPIASSTAKKTISSPPGSPTCRSSKRLQF